MSSRKNLLCKQQNSQAASLAKQQTKVQGTSGLHCTKLGQPTRVSLLQYQQNKPHQKHFYVNQTLQKQQYQSSQQLKRISKKLYVGNLNTNVTEININELFRLKSTEYLRQNCSVETPIDKNTRKSKEFEFLKYLNMFHTN